MPAWLRSILSYINKFLGVISGLVLYPVKMLLLLTAVLGVLLSLMSLMVPVGLTLGLLVYMMVSVRDCMEKKQEAGIFSAIIHAPWVFMKNALMAAAILVLAALLVAVSPVLVLALTAAALWFAIKDGVIRGWEFGLGSVLKGLFTSLIKINGIDLADMFREIYEHNVHDGEGVPDSQSTHRNDVGIWAYKSAEKLMNRYGDQIASDADLNGQLDQLTRALEQQLRENPDDLQRRSAVRAVKRFRSSEFWGNFRSDKVSLLEVLALAWIAIHDDELRDPGCSFDAALDLLINGLYECQRGNNLDEHFKDNQGTDSHICGDGSFNKILEKLVGIHRDISQISVTQENACIKFPIVVQEELARYLRSIQMTDPARLQAIVADIDTRGIQPETWQAISDSVRHRMYEEFGSLWETGQEAEDSGFVHEGYSNLIKGLEDNLTPDLRAFKRASAERRNGTGKGEARNNKLNSNTFFIEPKRPESSEWSYKKMTDDSHFIL